MDVKAGLVIDYGNSETRLRILAGGKVHKRNLSNKFAEMPKGYRVDEAYVKAKDGASTIFATDIDATFYANGYIVEREFLNVIVRPVSMELKINQLTTELTTRLAIINAMDILSAAYSTPIASLNVDFTVTVLVPPLEHEDKKDEMIAYIKTIASKTIVTELPVKNVYTFTVSKVNVQPEGVSAFFGALFSEVDDEMVDVEENADFNEGYVLVLDMGAGTSDVALMLNGVLVENSRESFKKGGNTIESAVRYNIKRKFGFSPSNVDDVVRFGKLRENTEIIDRDVVLELLNDAKAKCSKALKEDIIQYLERLSVELKEIRGILAVGGGALPTIDEETKEVISPAPTDVLVDYCKEIAPKLRKVFTGDLDLREFNILGAYFMHKYN